LSASAADARGGGKGIQHGGLQYRQEKAVLNISTFVLFWEGKR
jgi:hypothetical protein